MGNLAAAVASLVLIASTASVLGQTPDMPRVTPEGSASEATLIINELNTDDHPEVLVLATVLRYGVPLTGLSADDFRVREDEVDQEPLTVEPQLPPLSVVVALDTSGSMSRRIDATKEAAKTFVTSLGENDSVQLVAFERTIETMTPMTSTTSSVTSAIDGLVARGDTALYDALKRSVELLEERRGRKAVVVLSDGVDDDGTGQPLSRATVGDVLEHAGSVNVPIFTIGLGTEMDEAVLADVARNTGAQYLNAPDASELSAVYGQIREQLSGQYAIRYTSSLPADGTERRVDLAALGVQDSKTYAPDADGTAAAPATPPGTETGCTTAEAIEAERAGLQQAAERYDQGLYSITDRNAVRSDALRRMKEGLAAAAPDLACVREALASAKSLYGDNLIDISARNDLRGDLIEMVSGLCMMRPMMPDMSNA